MSWTEQKIQMLKDMWGHGFSASEIAGRLGGFTRNAVIGKAHRLKLSSRPSPIKRDEEGRSIGGLPQGVRAHCPIFEKACDAAALAAGGIAEHCQTGQGSGHGARQS